MAEKICAKCGNTISAGDIFVILYENLSTIFGYIKSPKEYHRACAKEKLEEV